MTQIPANNTQAKLTAKLDRLNQRLDFKISEPGLTREENQRATEAFQILASKLVAVFPDPGLTTDERLERLAKVALNAPARLDRMESDAAKLRRLQCRLDELLPGDVSHEAKIERLANLLLESTVNA
jgi:hypothetical protein